MVKNSRVFPEEGHFELNKVRGLTYSRKGIDTRPLVVFLPGGAHLARVFYGDPLSSRPDFLDYWLEEKGWGILALSYPSDHPSIGAPVPDLTIAAWAGWVAAVTADTLRETPARPVAVAMWSMAGRSVAAVNTALAARGVDTVCFLSLAASPPLPGLNFVEPGGDLLTPEGLWEGGVYVDGFVPSLVRQDQLNGHEIIDEGRYLEHYRCKTPVMLRGTPQRFSTEGSYWNHEEAHHDTRVSSFSDFPLTATISPTDPSDGKHVLCDRANWNFFNLQRINTQLHAIDLDAARWASLRTLTEAIPARLSRNVTGGHLFFLGASGAEATVAHIIELFAEVDKLRLEIRDIIGN